MKINLRWILIIVCLLVTVVLCIDILTDQAYILDSWFLCVFVRRTEFLTKYFKMVTLLADYRTIIVISGLLLISLFKKKKYSLYLIGFTLISTLVNYVFKLLVARPRPEGINLIDISGYSFPSGHAMGAMSFYGLIIYFIIKSKINKIYKWVFSILLSFIIINIGYSRIYLGVHYFTDVIVGYSISLILLIITTYFINKYGKDVV